MRVCVCVCVFVSLSLSLCVSLFVCLVLFLVLLLFSNSIRSFFPPLSFSSSLLALVEPRRHGLLVEEPRGPEQLAPRSILLGTIRLSDTQRRVNHGRRPKHSC